MNELEKMPAFNETMWPTLQALKDSGGSASNQELLTKVIQIMALSEDVQNVPHGDGPMTEIGYRLHWARTYLKKVGAIENSERGIWSITPNGRALTEADMKSIPAQARRMFRDSRAEAEGETDGDESVPATWEDQLLSILQSMSPNAFERLTQRVLRESGFVKVEVKGKSGDGGIDGVGVLRLNLLSFQVLFQCKRYKEAVTAGAIRDFRGAMVGRTDKGLFITTGRFTPDARKEATRDGAPPIDLIDGEQLCDLLKGLGLGVKTRMVEQVAITPATFAEFENSK
jgi:restriction system protein